LRCVRKDKGENGMGEDEVERAVVIEETGLSGGFLSLVTNTEIDQIRHAEWQQWIAACKCIRLPDEDPTDEYFPMSLTRLTIDPAGQVHRFHHRL
jgi:hypothetical protein